MPEGSPALSSSAEYAIIGKAKVFEIHLCLDRPDGIRTAMIAHPWREEMWFVVERGFKTKVDAEKSLLEYREHAAEPDLQSLQVVELIMS